jgi:phospholipid/cholesterol/gamma-HCH transport system substrate-binding protein
VKRLALIALAVLGVVVLVVAGTGAKSDSGGGYQVRAIFDSAFSVIPGEDVKVAGVKVGKIAALDVTPDNKAAVVLDIVQPGFEFRKDATCRIRPQSLIGERFVECTPTQPRAAGTPLPPPLPAIAKGKTGAGQHLLPVTNTEHTVDLDLLNNILRLPYRERLSILVNELGTGLAGNGASLNQAIRRASPALLELDKVLKILADQNRTLADLAVNGDRVLAPLAQRRNQVADFVVKANEVAQATAAKDPALEASFKRFPAFLTQLRPTMSRLGSLSDEMSPVLEDLGAEAPALNRFIRQLGPFSKAGIPALKTLGDAADVGTVALPKTTPILRDVRTLAATARPVADDLRATLESFRDTGGIERLMDYAFFQTTAINGFDQVGHYLRAGLIVNTCSSYVATPSAGCSSRFKDEANAGAASAAHAPTKAELAAFGKSQIAKARAANQGAQLAPAAPAAKPSRTLRLPSVLPGAPARRPSAARVATAASPSTGAQTTLLDYLLGGGS